MIHSKKLDGFWIHIDVDVLDDAVMPAVDSRTAGGLNYNEFDLILRLLLSDDKVAGLEITILDPDLDPGGKYTKAFVEHFCKSIDIVNAE
jgi:arginase